MIEQVIIQQKVTNISKWIETKLCSIFPTPLAATCQYLIQLYGAPLIAGLIQKENADVICHALPFCNNSPQCHLLPTTTRDMLSPATLLSTATHKAATTLAKSPEMAKFVVDKIQAALAEGVHQHRAAAAEQEKIQVELQRKEQAAAAARAAFAVPLAPGEPDFGHPHLPLIDLDGDLFASSGVYRGSHWRGRDCNDWSSSVYPGRKSASVGATSDYSCNGISGTQPASGQPWKEVMCSKTQQRGMAVIGDSAGAHFSIPVGWVTPSTISLATYSNFFSVLSDEFDFPENSAYTGYADINAEMPLYPVRSVYKELLRRNQCNFRDFQNLAVNGGDSYSVQTYLQALNRNNKTDHPMVVVLELLGNDVCDPAHSLDQATPPAVFKANIYKVLRELDSRLPANSHVVILGLADGRVLYDVLHDHLHPVGGGVTYEDLYNFLNCNYANPCWGWLNSDSKVRDATTAHAMILNQQYRDIIKETNYGRSAFKNFELIYYDLPSQEIMDGWTAAGRSRSELVEPVDGFHPNQYFLSILSDWLVAHLDIDNPDILGSENPQNAFITSVFGKQGGY